MAVNFLDVAGIWRWFARLCKKSYNFFIFCSIEYVTFSAHVDYTQNVSFMRSVMPGSIVLVHGEEKKMKQLKLQLEKDIRSSSWPGNLQTC
jgi:Cft2 family RNA processing exonuclease